MMDNSSQIAVWKSFAAAYKSWVFFLGTILSAITAFRLYGHFQDKNFSQAFVSVFLFFDTYVGQPFNILINSIGNFWELDFPQSVTDIMLLYLTLIGIFYRPVIRSGYGVFSIAAVGLYAPIYYAFQRFKKSERSNIFFFYRRVRHRHAAIIIGVFVALASIVNLLIYLALAILWVFTVALVFLGIAILFVGAPIIFVKLFKTPHIYEDERMAGTFETSNKANLQSDIVEEDQYIGDYRWMAFFSLVGFACALAALTLFDLVLP